MGRRLETVGQSVLDKEDHRHPREEGQYEARGHGIQYHTGPYKT